ncbi:HN1_G0032660.mRNA.1.CDS.1 [Saccharomyces cerevisiae]|nr:HN1_G0032660.mRNA.1.CDS.1 [Saccharomyces cerevisiae]CAI4448762.1 BAL_1a_G0019090.mRNA.1.CDS.1 [Saccharomyces cerevisiae]CAI7117857.1 BAL_1a_G0019090.mRNA.1.CDS.1 [Saccharomyces cerevisiae]
MSLRILAKRSSSIWMKTRITPALVSPITITTRFNSTTTTAPSHKDDVRPVDPKISKIVKDISQLTLLETSSLINELKTVLNIPEISMPMGGFMAGAAGAGAGNVPSSTGEAGSGAEEEAKPEAKTVFTVKLDSFDTKTKAKVIKEVKGLLGLSLVEAKKFVEAAPKVLKENVAKDDADKIKKTLEDLGAKVSLE